MGPESFDWEQLKWIVPVGAIVAAALWKLSRPACETLLFFLFDGTPRRDDSVKAALAVELEEIADHGERLAEVERMLAAQQDSMTAFEESLLAQGATLRDQIAQVFNPLKTTLEEMSRSLKEIARDTQNNGREISELRGMWDGSERRKGRDRRSE